MILRKGLNGKPVCRCSTESQRVVNSTLLRHGDGLVGEVVLEVSTCVHAGLYRFFSSPLARDILYYGGTLAINVDQRVSPPVVH